MATRLHPGLRCPRCGSSVYTNGLHVWCSAVWCYYGINVKATASEARPPACAACSDWGCGKCLDPEPTVSADDKGE